MSAGMDVGAMDMVTEDNDGEIPASDDNFWVVDLSTMLSEQLGKQLSMMSTYRVKGFQISLRNVNNVADNDAALMYGGSVGWYAPTRHRIDALQHAREYKRSVGNLEDDTNDPFSYWRNDRKYTGLRFNWSSDADSVGGATHDHTTALAGTEFSLNEIFDHYNQAIGGYPSEEGYDNAGGEGDAVWVSRTGLNQTESVYWTSTMVNRVQTNDLVDDGEWFDPRSDGWSFIAPANTHLPVLGGLLRVSGFHTNTDAPGLVEDEYYLQMTIMVEGWEGF